jgi:hypothetical protein
MNVSDTMNLPVWFCQMGTWWGGDRTDVIKNIRGNPGLGLVHLMGPLGDSWQITILCILYTYRPEFCLTGYAFHQLCALALHQADNQKEVAAHA